MFLFCRNLTLKSILIRSCQTTSTPLPLIRYKTPIHSKLKCFASSGGSVTSHQLPLFFSIERTLFRNRLCRIIQSIFNSPGRILFCSALGYHRDGIRNVIYCPPNLPCVEVVEETNKVGFFERLSRLFRKIFQVLKILLRTLQMCLLISPLILTAPLAMKSEWFQNYWFKFLIPIIEICGPVYVKLGQWASTR